MIYLHLWNKASLFWKKLYYTMKHQLLRAKKYSIPLIPYNSLRLQHYLYAFLIESWVKIILLWLIKYFKHRRHTWWIIFMEAVARSILINFPEFTIWIIKYFSSFKLIIISFWVFNRMIRVCNIYYFTICIMNLNKISIFCEINQVTNCNRICEKILV